MAKNRIEVFIVDDHSLIIEGLKASLETEPDISIVGFANTGAASLAFLKEKSADVALIDIALPDISGVDLCCEMLKVRPSLKVIGLTTHSQRNYISRLLANGAKGYLLKNIEIDEIKDAIRQVSKGHVFLCKEAGDTLYKLQDSADAEYPPLTRREVEILKLIAEGQTAPEIAAKLHLSQLTVESHRRNIMVKWKAKNTAIMVRIAVERNLFQSLD